MESFEYTMAPARVVFGSGTVARVPAEIAAMECARAFVVAGPGFEASVAQAIFAALGSAAAALSTDAAMHTPVEVTERVMERLNAASPDCLVAVGGGSATGLSKALAFRTGLPQLIVPTTYAGSEATPILGQSEAGRKTTLRSATVLPRVIVYDVELSFGMPVDLAVTSGMNAVAHAVEALYARNANPITSMMAAEAIRLLARSLPAIRDRSDDVAARSDALYAAWLCGTCLGTVGMGLHHKLCHVLGGSFNLPHAATHTVILPHVAAFNDPAAPDALRTVAGALGAERAGPGLFALNRDLAAPSSLAMLGMNAADLDEAAAIATASPYDNPREPTRADVRKLLDDAWHGRPPANWRSTHG